MLFTIKQRIYIVGNYFTIKSYQKTISLFECKFPSISPPNEASNSHLVEKFPQEGIVKILPHQECRSLDIFDLEFFSRYEIFSKLFIKGLSQNNANHCEDGHKMPSIGDVKFSIMKCVSRCIDGARSRLCMSTLSLVTAVCFGTLAKKKIRTKLRR